MKQEKAGAEFDATELNLRIYRHDSAYLRSLGFKRSDGAAMFIADCVTLVLGKEPSKSGTPWPSDVTVHRRLETMYPEATPPIETILLGHTPPTPK